jgi:galactokinase
MAIWLPARERAISAHRRAFGASPVIGASAPGRVNLIGEHTDYNGGDVLPIAIGLSCFAVVGPHQVADKAVVHAADLNQSIEITPAELVHYRADQAPRDGAHQGWPAYIAGVLALMNWRGPGLCMTIAGDVPRGSGLSSSAALEVAVATALEEFLDATRPPLDRARLCMQAEHEYAGVPCGLMDQAVSCLAVAGHALHLSTREPVKWEQVPMPAEADVLIVDTRVPRGLAETGYGARVAACRAAAKLLGVQYLCDAAPPSAGTSLFTPESPYSADLAPLVRHVTSEHARVLRAAQALRNGNMASLGDCLTASHASLRDDYRVSCEELDFVVHTASNSGLAWGAKMTGAGFGGCAVVLPIPGAGARLGGEIEQAFAQKFGRACGTLMARASGGAAVINLD